MEYSRGAGRYRAGVMPSRVSNDTKTFKFAAGPSRHGSRVFVLLTVLIVGPLLVAASYSCSSLLFLTWMSGLWVFSVLGVVTILRDGGVKPRVTQHAPSQSGTSPSNRGDQSFTYSILGRSCLLFGWGSCSLVWFVLPSKTGPICFLETSVIKYEVCCRTSRNV